MFFQCFCTKVRLNFTGLHKKNQLKNNEKHGFPIKNERKSNHFNEKINWKSIDLSYHMGRSMEEFQRCVRSLSHCDRLRTPPCALWPGMVVHSECTTMRTGRPLGSKLRMPFRVRDFLLPNWGASPLKPMSKMRLNAFKVLSSRLLKTFKRV